MASTSRGVRFKAVLQGSKPPIWRMIDMDADLTSEDLHVVLQVAFGWQGYHLHEFSTAPPYRRETRNGWATHRWGPAPDTEDAPFLDLDPAVLDERRQRVGRFIPKTTSLVHYLYDFGDDWRLRLEFIDSRVVDPAEPAVRIVKAKLCGPTEDSGGPWGWEEMRAAVADPGHERHAELVRWVQDVDPDR